MVDSPDTKMSDERLARIEAQLSVLVTGQGQLRTGQDGLRADVRDVRHGLGEVRLGLEEVRDGQILLSQRVDKLEIGQERMSDDIKGLADGQGALRISLERQIADLREQITQRLDPVEATVRQIAM